jgi:hypothetical protein
MTSLVASVLAATGTVPLPSSLSILNAFWAAFTAFSNVSGMPCQTMRRISEGNPSI